MSRLIQFVFVVFAAGAVVFVAVYVVSDPVRSMLPVGTPPDVVDQTRASLGLDRPLLEQLGHFMKGAITGDFGDSLWLGEPALGAVLDRVPATALLALTASLVGGLLGAIVGITVALNPGSKLDSMVQVTTYASISIAEFWLGLLLVVVFAARLGWLPTSGFDSPQSLVLPVVALGIRPFAHTVQVMRSAMLQEATKQYVVTARANGLTELSISLRHKLRNAASPVITVFMYDLGRVFVGTAVVIEVVFAWPGIGQLAVGGLERGDIFLVQAIVFVAAVITGGLNLVADLLYFALDPRTRALVGEAR